jgi:glutamate synthase (NADPH) small chain
LIIYPLMAEKMLKFITLRRAMPPKRAGKARIHDFDEIYEQFPSEQAAAQAARCSQCGVPFCQSHCPLHNNIPDWLKLAAEGRLEEAYDLSAATNAMPEICGRICPQDRLCEGACVIEQSGHGTVTIGAIEKYISDTAWARGWVQPLRPALEREQSIGIVGSGPAGLAAAEALRRLGYQVTVYERADRAGGLLVYGIPNFKLDKAIVERRVKRLADGGVVFKLKCEIGSDLSLEDLRKKHDAVFLATGVYRAREIHIPGSNLSGIVPALEYLIAANRAGLDGKPAPARLNAHKRDVVVIGGGDTAMDALRTAVRQGAKSVTCIYRRDRENMPGSTREVKNAEEEGVTFRWLTAPRAFIGKSSVESVLTARMRLGLPDASGRKAPEEIKGADYALPASLAIKALGFEPEDLPAAFGATELETFDTGALKVAHGTQMTNLPGVFAGGDIVRGASLVVWAIRDGREAAAAMHKYIQSNIAARAAE